MSRKDYDHWNEEADIMWWLEEGRHETYERPDYDSDWLPDDDEDVEYD